MKKQIVVRTFPIGYTNPTTNLSNAFEQGYTVVMANSFDVSGGKKGTEYILEKESEEE